MIMGGEIGAVTVAVRVDTDADLVQKGSRLSVSSAARIAMMTEARGF
jgi:hypothetical protein